MIDEITISDLYEGAYLLCRGLRMKGITVIGRNGKRLCSFAFDREDAFQLMEEYRAGRATANPAMLKFTIEKLKDRMFQKIREIERQEKMSRKPLQEREERDNANYQSRASKAG